MSVPLVIIAFVVVLLWLVFVPPHEDFVMTTREQEENFAWSMWADDGEDDFEFEEGSRSYEEMVAYEQHEADLREREELDHAW